jgi:hypothetical protein
LLLFPATIASFFGTGEGAAADALQTMAASLAYGQPLHLVLYAVLMIFFCFFYTALVFNARETSDNLKKSGAFIPGIRPGQQTGEYIDKVLTRLHRSRSVVRRRRRTVRVRWHLIVDRRGRCHGFHGATAGAFDVPSVSRSVEAGQSDGLWTRRRAAVIKGYLK